jgi:phospholipid transport system transporter-binding protein
MVHADAKGYLASCEAALGKLGPSMRVKVDAAQLATFDSTAIAVLLSLRRSVTARQGVLEVLNLPARLRDLATVYGVSELLPA